MFPWSSDKVVEMVGTMLLDGKSSSMIAAALSAEYKQKVTPNAISGQMNRKGMPKALKDRFGDDQFAVMLSNRTQRLHNRSDPRDQATPPRAKPQRSPARPRPAPAVARAPSVPPPPPRACVIVPPRSIVVRPENDGEEKPVRHPCKWPIGDPLSDEFCFCGEETGSRKDPYCPEHKKKASEQPVKKPKRTSF